MLRTVRIALVSMLPYFSGFYASDLTLITTAFPSKTNIATPMFPKNWKGSNTFTSPGDYSSFASLVPRILNIISMPTIARQIPNILKYDRTV